MRQTLLIVTVATAFTAVYLCALRLETRRQDRAELVQDQAVGGTDADACQLKDLRAVPNHKGYVAILRDVNCPGPLAQGSGYFVVFVHKAGEPNTKQNLVLQYEPGFQGRVMSGPPRIMWTGDMSLKIGETGVIEELDKKERQFDGVGIAYSLGPVESALTKIINAL
jgi:hypothetical protein